MPLRDLLSRGQTARKTTLDAVHPVYETHHRTWAKGLDAYDGSGGFLTGAYLWMFPRESADQYTRRRTQARYHNYSETLVDIYVRNLTTGVTRDTTNDQLAAWWADVDGLGTDMTTYIQATVGQALSGGHAGILVDKPATEAGVTMGDDTQPFLRTYVSTEILDWRLDGQGISAVKLSEDVPFDDLSVQERPEPGFLLWDREIWIRFDAKGTIRYHNVKGLALDRAIESLLAEMGEEVKIIHEKEEADAEAALETVTKDADDAEAEDDSNELANGGDG